jgi:hypothetical protein
MVARSEHGTKWVKLPEKLAKIPKFMEVPSRSCPEKRETLDFSELPVVFYPCAIIQVTGVGS